MDGYVAKLPEICDLAERYGAFVHGRRLPRARAISARAAAARRR